MNGCKNEDDCQTPTRCRHLSRCPNASSEEAAAQTAGQVSSLALATGSMSAAEAIAFCLDCDKAAAQCERLAASFTNPIEQTRWRSHADNFASAAKNMRQRMEAANVRQPTSNV